MKRNQITCDKNFLPMRKKENGERERVEERKREEFAEKDEDEDDKKMEERSVIYRYRIPFSHPSSSYFSHHFSFFYLSLSLSFHFHYPTRWKGKEENPLLILTRTFSLEKWEKKARTTLLNPIPLIQAKIVFESLCTAEPLVNPFLSPCFYLPLIFLPLTFSLSLSWAERRFLPSLVPSIIIKGSSLVSCHSRLESMNRFTFSHQ